MTEPIEFTFLFIAPPLFIVHCLLASLLAMAMNLVGCVGVFAGGLIEISSLNFIPLMANHWQQYAMGLAVGLVFTVIWFVVFRFLIVKFDFKTPGREDDAEEVKFHSKAEYRAAPKPASSPKEPPSTSTIPIPTQSWPKPSSNCSAAPTTSWT